MTAPRYTKGDEAEGPTLQRMRAGLPSTPIERLRELALAVVVRGLLDDDHELVVGADAGWFVALCRVVGLGDEQITQLRVRYCLNTLDTSRLDGRALHKPRYDDDDRRLEAAAQGWQSWPAPESRVLRR